MTKETGTLAELNVKPGDVVECVGWSDDDSDLLVGKKYTIMKKHPKGYCNELCAVRQGSWALVDDKDGAMLFRLVSRAAATPKTWGEMTVAEKGALLLAHHEGKVIEFYCYDGWVYIGHATWLDSCAYRVRPELKRETVSIYGAPSKHIQWCLDQCGLDTHRINFDVIDGKPDCASIRMEEL